MKASVETDFETFLFLHLFLCLTGFSLWHSIVYDVQLAFAAYCIS